MFGAAHDLLTSAYSSAPLLAVWLAALAGIGLLYGIVVMITRAEVRRIMRGYVVSRVLQPRQKNGRYRKATR